MAPRAYWRGYLKLSLVSCPIALFPATSEREKISFHQIIFELHVSSKTARSSSVGDLVPAIVPTRAARNFASAAL